MTEDTPTDPASSPSSPEQPPATENLADAIRRRFAPFGGVDDFELPPRVPVREPPRFDATLAEVRSAFADMPPQELEALIGEALAATRRGDAQETWDTTGCSALPSDRQRLDPGADG